jgi:hypothetical protein
MAQAMRMGLFAGGLAAAGLLGLGCDDECSRGASECISGSLIRICVPAEDGNEWLVTQCGANERCVKAPAAPSGSDAGRTDAGADAGEAEQRDGGSVPACVGSCRVGAHECVGAVLSRFCVADGVWQLEPCDVGEKCSDGTCLPSRDEDAVRACTPGEKACAGPKQAKQCDADGSRWIEIDCASNEICKEDGCAPDPDSSCDDANSCLDNKHAIRCLGKDEGFQLIECEGDTYCEGGRCRGAVCVLGSVCSGSNQVRECIDGKSYKDTQCGVNEICQQTKDHAKCAPLQCMPGTSACGDPRDSKVDPRKNFVTCVNGAGSGVPEWVKGECGGASRCNSMLLNSGNPCSQTCTKGAQDCASDPVTGVNDGYQECGDDGEWGPIQTCNPDNAGRLQCVTPMRPDLSMLPEALCAEPICQWVMSNVNAGATGACEGTQLRKCQPDGKLGDAADCEAGICRVKRSTTITADGRMPGACDTEAECKEGEEICANEAGSATPRYRSCSGGVWSAELKTCDGDAPCYNAKGDDGSRKKLCGVSCSPGTRRCSGNGQLEECDGEGRWGGPQGCAAGSCKVTGNNDAACVLECMPGTKLCTGSSVIAPDGFHTGTSQEVSCSAGGLRGTARDCDDGKVCRSTGAGVPLGCVECIGPNAVGGNAEGAADSRCDPDDAERLQDCSAGNTWSAGRQCSGDKTCVSPNTGTCSDCTGSRGGTFQCTESNIIAEPLCDSCEVMVSSGSPVTVTPCSEASIANTANATSTTCAAQGHGSPSNYAGVDNCCATAQKTAGSKGASCSSLGFGAPSAWGNVSDCCANNQVAMGGTASFAYCE